MLEVQAFEQLPSLDKTGDSWRSFVAILLGVLLSPGRIGGLELRNRIVLAAMGSNFAAEDGHCTERLIAYYEARAKGGMT